MDRIISDIMNGGFRRIKPPMELGISLPGVRSIKATWFDFDERSGDGLLFTISVYLDEDNKERSLRFGSPSSCWKTEDSQSEDEMKRFLKEALKQVPDKISSRQWSDRVNVIKT